MKAACVTKIQPAPLMLRARGIVLLAACLLVAFSAAAPAQTTEDPEKAARALVETLVRDAHAAMSAEELGEAARFEQLKEAISTAFAFDIWERFLLGDHELAPEQRERFRALLPGFLADLYAERFGRGLEAEPEVLGTRKVRRDILVEARIPRAEGKPLPVEYRVRNFEDRGPQVIDVIVGGVSFLLLKRDEFGALIESKGPQALLDFMEKRAR